MPGLAGRMSTVIKAKVSRLLDRAEDPGETLDYGYQKQLELLQNVKKGIADVVTSKKRLQMQSDKLEQSVAKLDTQARQALAAGREDLARTALERKTLAQNELQTLDQQVVELGGRAVVDQVGESGIEVGPPVGDRPLAWWAVKRVSEYSGRINLWLAGGFCVLYAAYLIAESRWPPSPRCSCSTSRPAASIPRRRESSWG